MELTCYVDKDWDPKISPASSKRAWMDATNHSFAYRCLPLSVANSHGWVMGSPCSFWAYWDGNPNVEAITFKYDNDVVPKRPPISIFGGGTITFHVMGLFRTSPGWNLWVSGPPNTAKHGIAPLSGLIETDWSPYTFTMNWRFTKAGEWIRFEENEPFCFFFPVQRGVVEKTVPTIRPFSDDPKIAEDFKAWSDSRTAHNEHLRKVNVQNPSDQWQKLYYRGLQPDGTPGSSEHQAKLRVPAFGRQAGDTRGAGGCPMHALHAKSEDVTPLGAFEEAAE